MCVRPLFDGLIQENPNLKGFQSASAEIVHDKAFENGIVKLYRGDVPTRDEANAPRIHKLEDEAADTNSTNMSFVARMLHNQEDTRKRRRVTAQYHSIAHVSPTFVRDYLAEQSL